MLSRSTLNSLSRARMIQRPLMRAAATTSLSQDDSMALLRQQRARRPNSPHLTIYRPQLTWILSSLNRITGVAVSGGKQRKLIPSYIKVYMFSQWPTWRHQYWDGTLTQHRLLKLSEASTSMRSSLSNP